MKMPSLEIGIKIRRRDGTVIKYSEPGHSWTRNAWNWAFACMTDATGDNSGEFGAGKMSAHQTSASIEDDPSVAAYRGSTTFQGFRGHNTFLSTAGMVIGSGDAVFSVNNIDLDGRISHGTSSGQMSYGVANFPEIGFANNIWTAIWTRTFTNNTAAAITVKECGMGHFSSFFTSTGRYFLFARDILDIPIDVHPTEVLEIQYRMRMSFSGLGSDNWTRNAWNWFFSSTVDCTGDGEGEFGHGYMSCKNMAGGVSSSDATPGNRSSGTTRGYARNEVGLRVGTGDNEFSVEDFDLDAIIAHGTGSGQLVYDSNGRYAAISYSGKKWTATIHRELTNNSGADITVKEIGLFYRASHWFGGANQDCLFYRKVLDSPVTIADNASHTFEVDIQMDFGDID